MAAAKSALEILAQFRDEASGGLKQLQGSIDRLVASSQASTSKALNVEDALKRLHQPAQQAGTSFKFLEGAARDVAITGLSQVDLVSRGLSTKLVDLAGGLGKVGIAAAGVAGLVVGAGVGLIELAKGAGNAQERMQNLALQTGLSQDSLEAIEQTASEAGESFDRIVPALSKINDVIAEVNKGNFEAAKGFRAIGVDLASLVQQGASTEDILQKTANALVAIDDPQRRAAASADIFGGRSRALQVVLDQIGKQTLPGLTQEMREAGIVTTDAARRAAEAADKMFDAFDRKATAVGKKIRGFAAEVVASVGAFFSGDFSGDKLAADIGKTLSAKVKPDLEVAITPTLAAGADQKIKADLANVARDAAAEIAQAQAQAATARAQGGGGTREAAIEAETAAALAGIEKETQARLKAAAEFAGTDEQRNARRVAAEETAAAKIEAVNEQMAAKLRALEVERLQVAEQTAAKRVALEEQVADASTKAAQAQEDAVAGVLEAEGHISAARTARLNTTLSNLDEELEKTKRVEAEKVRAIEAAAAIEEKKSGATAATTVALRKQAADQQVAAAEIVGKKEEEIAARTSKAYQDSANAIRATLSGTIDLVQRLTGLANSTFASARADLATEQLAKQKDAIADLVEAYPQLSSAGAQASQKLDDAFLQVVNGGAKSLDEAIDNVSAKTDKASESALRFGDAAQASFQAAGDAASQAASKIQAAGDVAGSGTLKITGSPNQAIQGPTGSFDLASLLLDPKLGQSRVPGTNDSLLEFTLRQIKAQEQVQEMTSQFLQMQKPGGLPSAGAGGSFNFTFNVAGNNIVDSDRRMEELSQSIGSRVADRMRRGG